MSTRRGRGTSRSSPSATPAMAWRSRSATTAARACEQLSVPLIRVPPHSDFEQGTGHYHDEVEELYLVTRGTLTVRLADDVHRVGPGSAVRVAPRTPRSHRNEGDEPVEIW